MISKFIKKVRQNINKISKLTLSLPRALLLPLVPPVTVGMILDA